MFQMLFLLKHEFLYRLTFPFHGNYTVVFEYTKQSFLLNERTTNFDKIYELTQSCWYTTWHSVHSIFALQWLLCLTLQFKGLTFWQYWMGMTKKCTDSSRHYFMNLDHLHPSRLTETFPVELFSHISCSSVISAVGICNKMQSFIGGKWVSWACRPSVPIVKDISIFLTVPNQSASCMKRELPCRCHNKWLPWLQYTQNVKHSAAHNRPYLTKMVSPNEGKKLNVKDVVTWYLTRFVKITVLL